MVSAAAAQELRFRGEKDVSGGKPWQTVILEDYAEFRKAGFSHPLMNEIENKFNTSG
jgi:hypothetical protein